MKIMGHFNEESGGCQVEKAAGPELKFDYKNQVERLGGLIQLGRG